VTLVAWLLVSLGLLGASDTLYYHEWRARLPARGRSVAEELRLHALRDVLYAALFATLPSIAFRGGFVALLGMAILAEIAVTLRDFVVEDRVRRPLGGVYAGERVMHALMGIVYGAMLASLAPFLLEWAAAGTSLAPHTTPVPIGLRAALFVMAAGVLLSGIRDLAASRGGGAWPWRPIASDG
jgi:hypothetical protein